MTDRLEQLQAMAESGARPPVAELLGMDIASVEEGRATMLMAAAFASTLEGDETFATVEYDVKLLRPVRSGRLEARAKVTQRGGTTGLAEADVLLVGEDGAEELVAWASSTCLVLRGEAGAERQVGQNLAQG